MLLLTPESVCHDTDVVLKRFDRLFAHTKSLRYGQLFLNIMAPKSPWAELYYQEDRWKAQNMIRTWMNDYQNAGYVNNILDVVEAKGLEKFFNDRHK